MTATNEVAVLPDAEKTLPNLDFFALLGTLKAGHTQQEAS
jgi:hypothetical protein